MAFTNSLASLVVNIVVRTARANQQINSVKGGLKSTGMTALNTAASLWILRAAFLTVRDTIASVYKSTAEFETAIVRITSISSNLKNTGFAESVERVGLALSGIQVKDLADVSLTAVKMGIEGKQAILEFSKVVNQFAYVTDTSTDTVADGFGRISNIFKILPEDTDRLANAILRVDEGSVVTAADILKLTQQFAGFAAAMGLNTRETIAFMAAMRAAGQTGVISRNALHRLMVVLLRDTEKVSEAIGLTGEQFKEFSVLIETDPAKGLESFMDKFKNFTSKEQEEILKKIGLSTVRVSGGMKALALAFDQYTKNLKNATDGMESNNDLSKRMFDRSRTLEGMMLNLTDAWEAFKRSIGDSTPFADVIANTQTLVESLDYMMGSAEKSYLDLSKVANVKGLRSQKAQQLREEKAKARGFNIITATRASYRVPRLQREIIDLTLQLNELTKKLSGTDIENVNLTPVTKAQVLARLEAEERSAHIKAIREEIKARGGILEFRSREKQGIAEWNAFMQDEVGSLREDLRLQIREEQKEIYDKQIAAAKKFEEAVDRFAQNEFDERMRLQHQDEKNFQFWRDKRHKKEMDALKGKTSLGGFTGLTEAWKKAQMQKDKSGVEQKKIKLMEKHNDLLEEIKDRKVWFNNAVGP